MNTFNVPNIKNKTTARFTVKVPGSKSVTNRALLLAAMSEGKSRLYGCLFSDDSNYFLECLRTLGFPVNVIEKSSGKNTGDSDENETASEAVGADIIESHDVEITGFGGEIPVKKAEIFVGSAGTAARFLAAMLAFSDGEYVMNSSEQMKKRPMAPLIDTLRSAGAEVVCLEEEGHFPLKIRGAKCGSKDLESERSSMINELTVDVTKSSQFLSALMIAAGTLGGDTVIRLSGNHGLAYADMTAEMMRAFGIRVFKSTAKSSFGDKVIEKVSYKVKASGKKFLARDYEIEPDMSAAAYFYAMAAITGAEVKVEGVKKPSLQGDVEFVTVLKEMGCEVTYPAVSDSDGNSGKSETVSGGSRAEQIINGIFSGPEEESCEIIVKGPEDGRLKGNITVDMSAFSDQALTLAAIAPFADGPVKITGISHIRLQECDRINAITENLRRLGIKTETEEDDSIIISPGVMHGAEIETYDDHRVAMAFALCGLRTEGVKILNPDCCKKTFKEYFEVFAKAVSLLS